MLTVGTFEAKTHFSALIEKVENGEQIVITKHGHPVAKLVPTGEINKENVHETIQRLKAFSKGNKLGGLDWKELRDEGRR